MDIDLSTTPKLVYMAPLELSKAIDNYIHNKTILKTMTSQLTNKTNLRITFSTPNFACSSATKPIPISSAQSHVTANSAQEGLPFLRLSADGAIELVLFSLID